MKKKNDATSAPAPEQATGPKADATKLISEKGLTVASEVAIQALIDGTDGAEEFAGEVLARLKAKNARVQAKKADKAQA